MADEDEDASTVHGEADSANRTESDRVISDREEENRTAFGDGGHAVVMGMEMDIMEMMDTVSVGDAVLCTPR